MYQEMTVIFTNHGYLRIFTQDCLISVLIKIVTAQIYNNCGRLAQSVERSPCN